MADLGNFVKKMDLFRQIDEGYLATATSHGGTCSLLAYVVMVALTIFEFSEYMSSQTTATVVMDMNRDSSLTVHFDIVMVDLPCRFAAVDVYDEFGSERMNVTTNITKTRLHIVNGSILETKFMTENMETNDNTAKEPAAEIELDEEGHHALDLKGEEGFIEELLAHDYTLMNFYAPWCHWCKEFAPTFEKAADAFDKVMVASGHTEKRAKFASLNCEKYVDICKKYNIRGYPTLQLFIGDKPSVVPYSGARKVEPLVEYLKEAVVEGETHMPHIFADLACKINGSILVPRVPGNFHVEARSKTHDINPIMVNLSHIVNHMQFGAAVDPVLESKLPTKHQFLMHPLDGKSFHVQKMHTAPQHYMKVVSTLYEFSGGQAVNSYQLTTQSRIATYAEEEIPEAKFSYDLSPISVIVSQERKPFYRFLTSLFAIVGGTYTVISLLDGAVGTVNTRLKNTIGKLS